MDRLIDALEVELDRDKRKQLWAEAQRLLADPQPTPMAAPEPKFFRAAARAGSR